MSQRVKKGKRRQHAERGSLFPLVSRHFASLAAAAGWGRAELEILTFFPSDEECDMSAQQSVGCTYECIFLSGQSIAFVLHRSALPLVIVRRIPIPPFFPPCAATKSASLPLCGPSPFPPFQSVPGQKLAKKRQRKRIRMPGVPGLQNIAAAPSLFFPLCECFPRAHNFLIEVRKKSLNVLTPRNGAG